MDGHLLTQAALAVQHHAPIYSIRSLFTLH